MAVLKEKQKIYVLIAIFGIVGLALYYSFLLKPLVLGFMANNKELRVVRERVKNEGIMIAGAAEIRRQHENYAKQVERLEKRLPRESQISILLEDFSKIAESSEVKIINIKPLEATAASSKQEAINNAYIEFPILIEARAGYHQLGAFVNKLENMDIFIKVTDIDIAGIDKESRLHGIKMKIITYVL